MNSSNQTLSRIHALISHIQPENTCNALNTVNQGSNIESKYTFETKARIGAYSSANSPTQESFDNF